MENKDTGILLNSQNIKLNRMYFQQMLKLLGINVLHRAPRPGSKSYNGHGELNTFYYEPVVTGAIWDEHPQQRTMKKLGWMTQVEDNTSIIHVPYDLQGVQVGSLFIIPSGLDNSEGRVFRVIKLTNIAVYPCSIACELAPVWINNNESEIVNEFSNSDMNVLADESEDYE